MEALPRKILRVQDLTYVLPDNFEGNLTDALNSFNEYMQSKVKSEKKIIDDKGEFTTVELILADNTDARVCGAYGIFELNPDNKSYKIIEDAGGQKH